MSRTRILSPRDALVDEQGQFALGLRTHPFRTVNPLDARLDSRLFKPRALRRLALKEWQHFALVDDRFYLSIALFDAKRLALAQIIVFDRETRHLHEYECKALPHELHLPDSLMHGRAYFKRGDFEIEVLNRLDAGEQGRHEIKLRAPGRGGRPSLEGKFVVREAIGRVEPMVVALPFDGGRAMYSHKAVLPCTGELKLGGSPHTFEAASSYGLVDVHKGYYPFVMTWHWATGARQGADGLVGFNLTDNQVSDQAAYNENGLWVGERLHPLPPVRFAFDANNHKAPWTISDEQGRVDLRFYPQALRKVDVNLLVFRSKYRGPYGAFEGTIVDDEGQAHEIDGAFGMCEDFYLRA